MRHRAPYRLDSLAHFLYQPTALGPRAYRTRTRTRRHHRIHLIPQSLFVAICDRYDEEPL